MSSTKPPQPPKLPAPYSALIDRTQDDTHLPAADNFSEADHHWDDAERWALVHAWANQRPLLVRGEPGCGKSQLARAAAAVLRVPLIVEVIHPRFEATDLKYREDHVRRLAEAQVLAATRPDDNARAVAAWVRSKLAREKFIDHGAIWRAMETPDPTPGPTPGSRSAPSSKSDASPLPPEWPRAVLLIDEIDKADSDIPNALLDVLANRSFKTPADEVIRCERHFPLMIVTTNEDRELPPAFLRRCAVLSLNPPRDKAGKEDQDSFTAWLIGRAMAHTGLKALVGKPMQLAAAQTWADRTAAANQNLPTVGLAEYLDLLYSLRKLSGDNPRKALALLRSISPFALVKNRDQDQRREPVADVPDVPDVPDDPEARDDPDDAQARAGGAR